MQWTVLTTFCLNLVGGGAIIVHDMLCFAALLGIGTSGNYMRDAHADNRCTGRDAHQPFDHVAGRGTTADRLARRLC